MKRMAIWKSRGGCLQGKSRCLSPEFEHLEDRRMFSLGLLADINPADSPSNPTAPIAAGSLAYFIADDGHHGKELWATDGTTQGTHLVIDMAPETASPVMMNLTAAGDKIFVVDGYSNTRLWLSDGTEAGTVVLKSFDAPISKPVAMGGSIYFALQGTVQRTTTELWKSDGTVDGTIKLADTPGAGVHRGGGGGSAGRNSTDAENGFFGCAGCAEGIQASERGAPEDGVGGPTSSPRGTIDSHRERSRTCGAAAATGAECD
jgi:ELWxxDGT repeat protein